MPKRVVKAESEANIEADVSRRGACRTKEVFFGIRSGFKQVWLKRYWSRPQLVINLYRLHVLHYVFMYRSAVDIVI